jgi:hypothetical protein
MIESFNEPIGCLWICTVGGKGYSGVLVGSGRCKRGATVNGAPIDPSYNTIAYCEFVCMRSKIHYMVQRGEDGNSVHTNVPSASSTDDTADICSRVQTSKLEQTAFISLSTNESTGSFPS